MTFKILCTADDPNWLDYRRQGLTATDTAKIMGMSKYGSAMDVYLDKLGALPAIEENPKMKWGRKNERTIIETLPEERPKVRDAEQWNVLLQSIDKPFMIATLDGIAIEDGKDSVIIEAKASAVPKLWEDGPPDEYVLQLQKQLFVTGFKKGYLCALINGWDYRIFEFLRDDELIAMIVQAETDFWNNHVEARVMPSISPIDTEAAKHLYPKAIEDTVILPGDLAEVCRVAAKARVLEKVATQAKEWADNRLKMALGEYKTGVVGEYKLTWSNVARTTLDTTALKKAYPKLYARFSKTSNSRRFTIKEQDDGENNRRLEEQATRAITAELGIDEGYVRLIEDSTDIEQGE